MINHISINTCLDQNISLNVKDFFPLRMSTNPVKRIFAGEIFYAMLLLLSKI